MIHHTRGIYASGEYHDNGVSSEFLANHIGYNLQMRPGRALIVDGVIISAGINVDADLLQYHVDQCTEITMSTDTAPYK